MYTLNCPHCENNIELLGQKDLTTQYRLTPNRVVRLLSLAEMPEAALSFENRRLWTRQQIEDFRAKQSKRRVQSLLVDTEETLSALSEEDRAVFYEALLSKAKESGPKRR